MKKEQIIKKSNSETPQISQKKNEYKVLTTKEDKEKEEYDDKKLNPDQRQAVSIALIMGGNMSGAIKAIEKIKKGLSKDKKVKNALKMANEGFASAAQRRAAFASGYKAKGKKKKKEGVKEGKFTKIMKAVRKGPKAGPWTFIISKNNKITTPLTTMFFEAQEVRVL